MASNKNYRAITFAIFWLLSCCSLNSSAQSREDKALIRNLELLSSSVMEGRKPGTKGHKMAQNHIIQHFKKAKLKAPNESYLEKFTMPSSEVKGENIVGIIPGSKKKAIVISAHYDHLGKNDDQIYYGADDNASGTAALLYLAKYFQANPLEHTLIFTAFDAEESGLLGSKHFVSNFQEDIAYNVNMDMIGRGDKKEIYACGTAYNPVALSLINQLDSLYSDIRIKTGHDQSGTALEDWTFSSDHGPFHRKGIPFLYFGVEDHPDYHRPSDTFDKINPAFYTSVVHMIADFIKLLDKNI